MVFNRWNFDALSPAVRSHSTCQSFKLSVLGTNDNTLRNVLEITEVPVGKESKIQ